MDPNQPNIKNPNEKLWSIAATIIVIIILLAIGIIVLLRYLKKDTFIDRFIPSAGNQQTTKLEICKLDGIKTEANKANRHPLAIMIENHPESRPQSGLDKASLVYEAITEGGITRFMAVYGPRDTDKVGPVRSVRTYFVDWCSEFDCFLAHVGGNLDALDKIKAENILDLDQFGIGEPTYWRVPQAGKAIEHTMYTSIDLLYKAANKKGFAQSSKFQALSFRRQNPNTDSNQKITIDFSESQYKVSWEYNAQTNTYLRNMGGSPHRDRETGDRLAAANIIIQEVERWEAITAINEQGWAMKTIGTGRAKIFIEGKEINGTWKKTSRTDRTIFLDNQGNEVKFIPGVFWYEIAPSEVFDKVLVE